MNGRAINFGGALYDIKVTGADDALDTLNSLNEKLKEANDLIEKLASCEVKVNFNPVGDSSQ